MDRMAQDYVLWSDIAGVVSGPTMFFWVKSPRELIGRCQRSREACWLHLQGSIFTSEMERTRFSEILVYTKQSVRRLNPKEHCQSCQRRENL
jgi:hypothetical protein